MKQDEEGWYVDDNNGNRLGWCNSCGEDADEYQECCDDGEIVPHSLDT